MNANDSAVAIYLQALLDVANGIYKLPTQGDNKNAALSIHSNAGGTNPKPADLPQLPAGDPSCKQDMASKFNHFFRKTYVGCGIIPLQKMMVDFINNASINGSMYYYSTYYNEPSGKLNLQPEQLMTAYYPGTRQGTTSDGLAENPIKINTVGTAYSTKRNFYSTKFFHMAKVIKESGTNGNSYKEQPALMESDTEAPADIVNNNQLKNPLNFSDVGNNKYFLDF